MKKKKNLYEVVYETFIIINDIKKIPIGLKYRLININARNLDYGDFMYYFDLNNEFEVLKFILDDNNMEEITRYSFIKSDPILLFKTNNEHLFDAQKEHFEIDISLSREERGYCK